MGEGIAHAADEQISANAIRCIVAPGNPLVGSDAARIGASVQINRPHRGQAGGCGGRGKSVSCGGGQDIDAVSITGQWRRFDGETIGWRIRQWNRL